MSVVSAASVVSTASVVSGASVVSTASVVVSTSEASFESVSVASISVVVLVSMTV